MPPPALAGQMEVRAQQTLGPGRIEAAARLHLTLALTEDFESPGDAPVSALQRAGKAAAAGSVPFGLALDRLTSWGRLIALRPSAPPLALAGLQSALAAGMSREQVAMREGWAFDPHVTLARKREGLFDRSVPSIDWPVERLVLVHSLSGLGRYLTLDEWPLASSG